MSLRTYKAEREKKKRESKTFKKLMERRTKAAQRRAYEEEALKVAGERGRELARRPSFGRRVVQRAKTAYKSTRPVRRQIVRRPVRRTMRRAAVKRKTITRRKKPVRRTMRRAATQQQETQQQPFDIGNLI